MLAATIAQQNYFIQKQLYSERIKLVII